MKKYLLASVAALGLVAAGAASAADLPSRKGPVVAPVYAPAFTWTGFYVGANAGYAWGEYNVSGAANPFRKPDGFVGGGQIGYNYQIGQIVLGLEADFQGADLKSGVNTNGLGVVSRAQVDYFGTVRARVGYAVDRFLPYITGGYAFAHNKIDLAPGVVAPFGRSDDKTHNGYAIGAGVEYAFTNNLTAKVEYLYVDMEKKAYFGGAAQKTGFDFSVVRAGLNYKF